MQPNEIVLTVDEDNDGVTTADVNLTYTRFEENLNRSSYITANHSLDTRDTLGLYRTIPKSNGNFKGTAKSSLKFTRDIQVLGKDGVSLITAPQLIEVSSSNPIGATPAQTLEMRQRAIAILDRDDIMAPLMDQLLV